MTESEGPFKSFSEFLDGREHGSYEIEVVEGDATQMVFDMTEKLFHGLDAGVHRRKSDEGGSGIVLLRRDGEVVASSDVAVLRDALLAVNTDLYRTGAVGLGDVEPPDVVLNMSDKVFTLKGYPKSDTEKLVLTLMSRYIEQRAWMHGVGSLRTGFQRLSRLDDESGTREVYSRLASETDVDVHVYGVGNPGSTEDLDVSVHSSNDKVVRESWFVVHRTPGDDVTALVAVEVSPATWRGCWTFKDKSGRRVDEYVSQTL